MCVKVDCYHASTDVCTNRYDIMAVFGTFIHYLCIMVICPLPVICASFEITKLMLMKLINSKFQKIKKLTYYLNLILMSTGQ